MKTALICGGHGFIGHHMAKRLKSEGYWVRTVDINEYEYGTLDVDDYVIGDLRNKDVCEYAVIGPEGKSIDEVYQFSADMGGAGYIFTGDHDADVMHNSALINLNMAECCKDAKVGIVFYSSSACMYPAHIQEESDNPGLKESDAYPAAPDSEYGWEKLFSERLYLSFHRNYGLNVRIARFHNIFGPEGSWCNGKEKAPAAMCRKVAETPDSGEIEIWGDGEQTRSFLYIDECLEGIRRLMAQDVFLGPVNIGSDEMVTINHLAEIVKVVADKPGITFKHIEGPLGVRGRSSENTLIEEKLGWRPTENLRDGIMKTYPWILEQVNNANTES